MGTGRDAQLNPFIANPFGEQDWGSQPPKALLTPTPKPSTGEQRASSAQGVTKGIPKPTWRDRAMGGAQSCKIIYELYLEGEGEKISNVI